VSSNVCRYREEGAQTLIEQMTRDLDPIIRYGGMFTIALAYRGTANNGAVQQLLHFAVSDVNDNVRRAAVLCLGFLLLDTPQQCPRLVSLLVRLSPFLVKCWARHVLVRRVLHPESSRGEAPAAGWHDMACAQEPHMSAVQHA
jgi:HEAT repeats